ncbi:glycine cleavage system protein GcvH [Truepera radiovictrix]|uniref:Glycine cleavage system H protein n=1 Tax=Truepera radiovictrix (strain DSM 17093 / CIP 108686 / LMG 22925 / RQ-24) TaxID=649638 RepID=D7CVH9_TRURR|nr:glycine cleavage system protein GcvH [Truepera radiovictrix]ADI14207.1 glycine cleavage system H protein [Truepera radiovictrix DSM 17093]WMT57235.1 glycine cleavage system protein GcvH [Truepera radiovictrix]
MNTPKDLRYSPTHEWSKLEGDTLTVGITDFAQDQLGDVVFVELPEVGREVAAGEAVAVVESVKTASDIYAPVAGTVTEVNSELETSPETINSEPYGGGWMFRLRVAGEDALSGLLSAEDYEALQEQG